MCRMYHRFSHRFYQADLLFAAVQATHAESPALSAGEAEKE